ncbi:hypothetical protein GCM10022209_31140 [Chitinophaga oryziterrae]
MDYYKYYVQFAGVISTFELDNPHSIVDKIIFQLEYNNTEKSVIYLKNHFFKLKTYPKAYMETFSKYAPVIEKYNSWIASGYKYQFIKTSFPDIIHSLKDLREELQHNFLKKAVDTIKHFVLCECPVDAHLKEIIFHTRLLASEIVMIRGSKNQAQELFEEIMTNDFTKFPYPRHLYNDDDKRGFFDTKTIHETLDAINSFSNRQAFDWDVNFKIEGLTLPLDYVFNFGDTSLFPANHPDKKVLQDAINNSMDDLVKGYLSSSEHSIAEVRVKSVTYNGAYREAIKLLNFTIEYINQVLGQSLMVNRSNYFFSKDRINYGYFFGDLSGKIQINQFERIKLEDNAYQFFNGNPSPAKEKFLQLEQSYVEARGKNDIAGLWQYLEALLKDGTADKKVKAYVSGAILLHEKQFRYPQIYEYLRNSIHVLNTNHKDIGITIEEQTAYVRKELDFKDLKNRITSVFFHHAFRELKTYSTKNWIKTQRSYYYSLLEEAYEQRNFIQHGGKFNSRANIKLTYSFPIITARLRWVFFDYIKRFPTKDLKGIIEAIKEDVGLKFGSIQ